jgi:hypothetical protein
MVILAVIGSYAIFIVGTFGFMKAWDISRFWLRTLALFVVTGLTTVGFYWYSNSVSIAFGAFQTDQPVIWLPAIVIGLFWLIMTFIIDSHNRTKHSDID